MSLRCKVCGKEFPEFDQRGFRNAGFTAHQNRCIGRAAASAAAAAASATSSAAVPVSASSPPHRRLLPASTPSPLAIPADHWQQPYHPCPSLSLCASPPPTTMAPSPTVSHHSLPLTTSVLAQHPTVAAASLPSPLVSTSAASNFYPVHPCEFCTLQHGTHDAACPLMQFLIELVNEQQGTSLSSPSTSSQQPF